MQECLATLRTHKFFRQLFIFNWKRRIFISKEKKKKKKAVRPSGRFQKKKFLKEQIVNSFAVIFENEQDCESVFWITYSMWKSKYWHRNLCGSVIPFLRLQDFKNDFSNKAIEMFQDFEQHKKDVEALRLLELKETQFHQNINLINDLRRVILYRYCK